MKSHKREKRIYITWLRYSSRSDSTAHAFSAKSYNIYPIENRSKLLVPIKYLLASVKTAVLLFWEHPRVVFVQNPPTIAVLVVWIYCYLFKAKLIIDTHCGAFTLRRWATFLWLYRFLSKRALTNILHNEHFVKIVRGWGASAIDFGAVPRQMKTERNYHLREGFNVVYVSSFAEDEPLGEVICAAENLPHVNFYITGDLKLAPKKLIKKTSNNVIFTGFIPHEDYVALLKGCKVVICLTNNNFTNQAGAYEAVAIGRPIIASNWSVLREIFNNGTIHIDNNSASIVSAIKEIQKNYSFYLRQIQILRKNQRAKWEMNYSELVKLLSEM